MGRALEHKSFRLGQPGLHQVVSYHPARLDGMAICPKDGQDRLRDAPCLRRREAPLPLRREFNPKEPIGVSYGLRESPRQHPVQHASVLRTHHGLEEGSCPGKARRFTSPASKLTCPRAGRLHGSLAAQASIWYC